MSIYDKASLVLIPSGTKTSKVYSQKPVSGDGDFTFSRSTAATRVNADGNIEKETQNLLLQSNTFDTTWSTANGASVTSGQSGYDGSSDAWLLSKTATAGSHLAQSVSGSGVQSYSIYVKANTLSKITLWANVVGSGNPFAEFDLSTQTLSDSSLLIDSDIVSIGNDWYRVSATFNQTITIVRIYIVDFSDTTAGSIYIQDAQLEQGLVARDYIETTTSAVEGGITDNVPRLDYTDSSCPALLLEPQRSNLITHSEYVSTWAQNNADITLSDNLSPEGYKNCWRVEGTSSGTQVGVATFNLTQGATYTASIWIRKVSGSDTAIFRDVNNNPTTINITTEWERYTLTSTTTGTTARLYVMVQNVGDVIEVYGAQLEEGSYATSYIPTYGTSVTRSDDYMTTTPTDLLGSTTGSWFMEMDDMTFEVTGTSVPTIYLGDNTQNCLALEGRNSGNNKIVYLVKEEGGAVTTLHAFTISGKTKFCFVWSGTTLKVFRDGTEEYSSNSFTQPTNWDLFVFNHGGREAFAEIRNVTLFPTALTDQEAIDLTTL